MSRGGWWLIHLNFKVHNMKVGLSLLDYDDVYNPNSKVFICYTGDCYSM